MILRRVLPLLVMLLAGCSGGNPPPPVAVASATPPAGDDLRPLSSRETAPAPGVVAAPAGTAVDPVDPAEAGITDLARLARYVFRTMRQHEDACPFGNPLQDRLHFALDIDVKAGRMTRVGVGHVGHGADPGQSHEIPAAQYPRELTGYVSCIEPHLKAVVMAPAPADGHYEPVYSYPGNPAGLAAH